MIISIVGYAKSGKTSFAEYIIREAASLSVAVAVLKTGRAAHHSDAPPFHHVASPDSERLRIAGATVSLFWSERGIEVAGAPTDTYPTALPDRNTFYSFWHSLLPDALRRLVDETPLVVIEGRPVKGSAIVQMRKQSIGGAKALKYPVASGHTIVTDRHSFSDAAASLLVPFTAKERLDVGTRR